MADILGGRSDHQIRGAAEVALNNYLSMIDLGYKKDKIKEYLDEKVLKTPDVNVHGYYVDKGSTSFLHDDTQSAMVVRLLLITSQIPTNENPILFEFLFGESVTRYDVMRVSEIVRFVEAEEVDIVQRKTGEFYLGGPQSGQEVVEGTKVTTYIIEVYTSVGGYEFLTRRVTNSPQEIKALKEFSRVLRDMSGF